MPSWQALAFERPLSHPRSLLDTRDSREASSSVHHRKRLVFRPRLAATAVRQLSEFERRARRLTTNPITQRCKSTDQGPRNSRTYQGGGSPTIAGADGSKPAIFRPVLATRHGMQHPQWTDVTRRIDQCIEQCESQWSHCSRGVRRLESGSRTRKQSLGCLLAENAIPKIALSPASGSAQLYRLR